MWTAFEILILDPTTLSRIKKSHTVSLTLSITIRQLLTSWITHNPLPTFGNIVPTTTQPQSSSLTDPFVKLGCTILPASSTIRHDD